MIFMDDIEHLKIEEIGPKFENNERFPNRVNTEFVKVLDRKTASMRVGNGGQEKLLPVEREHVRLQWQVFLAGIQKIK